MKSIIRFIRRKFLAGILVLVPLGVTVLVLKFLFTTVDSILAPYIAKLIGIYIPGLRIPGLGVVATVLLIFIAGLLATNIFGKMLLKYFDRGLSRIPFVGSIYVAAKQVIEAFGTSSKKSFKRVVFLEYPRRGILTIGFVTRDTYSVVDEKGNSKEVINLFVPTTPNPTSGFFIIAGASDVVKTALTVEDGVKLIVSGGIIVPPQPLMLDNIDVFGERNES